MSGSVAFVVADLVKRYGSTTVIENASVSIHERTKVGIIGRNGAGKSTLCRILLGQEEPDAGTIVRSSGLRVGYLEQHDLFELDETAGGFLERHTGKEEWRCGEVAAKLGLKPEHLASTMGELSGGFRTRVKLAAMLLADPDFLILDEPTNFLDLSTVLLLQAFLASFRGGVLVVSHDREFLRASCDHTLLVERGGLTLYRGNIEEFFTWKAEQMAVARRTNVAMEAKREHLQSFVNRFKAKASKASQARSKAKQIERLKPVTIANPLATVRIRIPTAGVRPGLALAGEDLTIGYPDHSIASGFTLAVDAGDKVAIVGDNGQGKTTLLRTLASDLPALGGRVRLGYGNEISYYAQHVYQSLNPLDTVESHLRTAADREISRQEVLAMAGSLLFRGDDVEKRVDVLSGGERARLCLAGLLLARRPILVLDEPTNHLDFETVEALGAALHEFAGAVLFVSHDRTFVNMVATQVVEVNEGRVRRLPGSYADYVENLQRRALDRPAGKSAKAGGSNGSTPAAGKTKTAGEAHAERRRQRNARKGVERALREVEKRVKELEEKRAEIRLRIEGDSRVPPEVYSSLAAVENELSEAEPKWIELSDRLEALSS